MGHGFVILFENIGERMDREKWAVLATGPSLTQAQVDALKGKRRVVAVSDAYKLCPWADAIASSDRAWWMHHQDQVRDIRCLKYHAGQPDAPMAGHLLPVDGCYTNLNSGALGIMVAVSMGARDVILLGFDMTGVNGAHFFGDHPPSLKSTPEHRFDIFQEQFRILSGRLVFDGVRVVNCTPGTHLKAFPLSTLDQELS